MIASKPLFNKFSLKPPLKILHTADLHLGAKFVKLGSKGSEQRKRLCQAFGEIVALAIREKVDVFLLAGDTFDNQQPSPESLAAFQTAAQQLQAAHIPVIIIAGTHDFLAGQGALSRYLKKTSESIVLLHSQRPFWKSDEKQIIIHGVSLDAAQAPLRPLAQLRRGPEPYWQIGMAHASLEIGRDSAQEAAFSREEISATELDYLALGHWHSKRDCSAGKTVCWYAGSPEMIALDEAEPGQVLLVELQEKSSPKVTAHTIGKRSLLKLALEVKDPASLILQAREYADPERILDLTLTGIVSPGQMPEPFDLQKELQDDFFFVQVRNAVIPEISTEDLKNYPEQTVIGRFIRLVQERKQVSNIEQKDDLDQALQLGIALLSGREVPPCY